MENRVNYGTAIYASAKGFDWPCDELYLPHNIAISADGRWCDWNHEEYYENEEDGNPISRPRQSELQTWLRKIHGINVWVYQPNETGYWAHNLEKKAKYDSYEEALEIALQEGLKLINNGKK